MYVNCDMKTTCFAKVLSFLELNFNLLYKSIYVFEESNNISITCDLFPIFCNLVGVYSQFRQEVIRIINCQLRLLCY